MATALKNVFSRQGARLEDGRQLSQGRLLVSVSQHQGHCLKVEVDEQRVASLRGPVDQVRWVELEFTLQMIKDAVIRVELVQAASLVIEALIVQNGPGWNPVMELRLLDADEVDLPRIQATALAVLQAVVYGDSGIDDVMATLPQQDLVQVRDVAKVGLNRMGGRKLFQPLEVSVDQQPVARLAGQFAARPNYSNFNPEPMDLKGRLRGFDVDEEALIFQGESVGRILIRYGKQEIDLVGVAQLCMNKGGCTARVHKTLDRRGDGVYALVKIVPCSDSGSLSPPGNSRKIESSTSSTSS